MKKDMSNREAAEYILKGFLDELAADGMLFELSTVVPRSEPLFHKPVHFVRVGGRVGGTTNVDALLDAMRQLPEAELFDLKVRESDRTTLRGEIRRGRCIGRVRIDFGGESTAVISRFMLGTAKAMVAYCGTAVERAHEVAGLAT